VEFENLVFTDPGWGDWSWNPETSEWEGGTGDPPATPEFPPEDGWSDGDFGLDGFGLGGIDGTGDAYTATIGFTDPFILYPEVYYLAFAAPNYAGVRLQMTVDNPPVKGSLQITVADGTFDPDFGGGNTYTFVIPEGETRSGEQLINGSTMDGLGNGMSSGCATRTLSVVSYAGGGYVADGSTPGLNVSATQSFDICAYSGTVSWGTLGIWQRNTTDSKWEWITDDPPDWRWNYSEQRWDIISDGDWAYDPVSTTWTYSGEEDPEPSQPGTPPGEPESSPPGIPDTLPPGGGYTTLVVHALVDMMPVPNGANDLEIDLGDGDSELYGTLVIPAVPNAFGHWRWVAVTQVWQYVGSNISWRWHSQLGQWQYLADPDWSWNTSTETFTWQGEGDAPSQPGGPPTQGGSTFPPDGEKWTLAIGGWAPPSSGAYALSGGAPDAGPYEGFKTLHFLPPEPEAPEE
jgi:hypothetical protein